MRLIDADKFEAYSADGTDLEGEEFLAYLSGMQRVLEDIDAAPTIDPESLRPRWIHVTERMPVEAKKVLCFLALSGGPMVETGYYMGDEGWYYTGIEAPHHGIVTHWMPLPEPPEVSDH